MRVTPTAVPLRRDGWNQSNARWALRASVARPITLRRTALGLIVLLSAWLDFAGLATEGYANTYYAAAVRSMLQNWHNFYFVSFDPGGFVSVDKPPLGLWLQVASAKVFGFSGVSILLPQGVAAIASVLVLYALVSRRFGYPAGLIAALAFALTPVAVVDNRNNTSDSVLVLLLLLAAWAVTRATENANPRWLLAGAAFVGLAFNVKEFEAFIIFPGLALMYLVGARVRLRVRIAHLLLAGVTTLIVSFAWIVSVDLTPTGARPYVSDSGTNSELSLALGYNGFGRLATGLLSRLPNLPFLHVSIDGSIVPGISMDIGNPGLLRLLRPAIGGQASWLLVLALVGLAAGLLLPGSRLTARSERAALLFWGGWLLLAGTFFSVARFYHLYYLILIAAPIAALTGIGMTRLWAEYRAALMAERPRPWTGWSFPCAALAAGWAQMQILNGYASWNPVLGPFVLVLCIAIAGVLVLGRLGVRMEVGDDLVLALEPRAALGVVAVTVASLMIAPTAFAAESISGGNGAAWLPQAGPAIAMGFGGPGGGFGVPRAPGASLSSGFGGQGGSHSLTGGPSGVPGGRAGGFGGGGAITFAGASTPTLSRTLIRYLESHQSRARYLVGTATSTYASLFVLQSGRAVMDFGGYQGWDRILTLAQLKRLIAAGTIRYFLLDGSSGSAGGGGFGLSNGVDAGLSTINQDLVSWITTTCATVPSSRYGSSTIQQTGTSSMGPGGGPGSGGAGTLYDCRGSTG